MVTRTVILSTSAGPALCFETPTGRSPWTLSLLTPSGSEPGGTWDTFAVQERIEEFLMAGEGHGGRAS